MYAGAVWIELHCHSTCSDGSEAPDEVATRAARRGVEVFCLTDHDSCTGYPDTLGSCPRVLRGLELSCVEGERTVHVLLYDIKGDDARWKQVEERLEIMRETRMDRLRAIAERLERLGIAGVSASVETIIANANGRTVGRPDIARILLEKGAISTLDEAYRRFIGDGGIANVPVDRFSVAEGLDLGQRAGARMALAHPHTLGERAGELVRTYRDRGLQGLECYYGSYNHRQRRRWLQLASKLDLVVTGGSDFHGTPGHRSRLGRPRVPDAWGEALVARIHTPR